MTVVAFILSTMLLCSIYLNVRLFIERRDFDDLLIEKVNESLAVLDQQYSTIVRVTSRSVMSNTPEVRTVAAALVSSRDAIINAARIIEDVIVDDNSKEVEFKQLSYVGADIDDASVIQSTVPSIASAKLNRVRSMNRP